MRLIQLLFISLLVSQPYYAAQAAAHIEGLQLPAWIDRGNERQALKPGTELFSGDQIATGSTGRIIIRTADGSLIKLGINAEFSIDSLEAANDSNDSVFNGFWKVLQGAFRFSTTALGANRKRNITINVGTATIGIRGTDIWGKANSQQDLVCLIEGTIEVTRERSTPLTLSEPLSVYTAPRGGGAASPLSKVDMGQLSNWGAETELLQGQGVLAKNGRYTVYLLSSMHKDYAENKRNQFQLAGYPAEVTSHNINDRIWHRVGIEQFSSLKDAKAFAKQIAVSLHIPNAWIDRQTVEPTGQ